MAFKHGFFNAIYDEQAGDYFPRYDAGDFARRFSLYFTNGVFYNASNALQVTAGNGMQVRASAGAVNINGYDGVNEQVELLELSTADPFYPRYDIVTVRLDISNKKIGFNVIKGVAGASPAIPTIDNLVRSSSMYDLMLAYIYVPAGATAITNANITDTRGNNSVCGFVAGTVNQLATDTFWTQWQARFNEYAERQETDFMAWWNGLKARLETLDVTALLSRQDALEARLNAYHELNYICTGVDDNFNLSTLVQLLYEKVGYGNAVVKVYGEFRATNPIEGTGTASSWYKWLKFGNPNNSNIRVTVDFSECEYFNVSFKSGAYNTLINGGGVHIKGLNVYAKYTTAGTAIRIFDNSSAYILCENCYFNITGYQNSIIAPNGTFKDCKAIVRNTTGNSYCFATAQQGLIRVVGGEYCAYTADGAGISAVCGQVSAPGGSVLNGVNCPTVAESGYYQTNAVYITGGSSSVTNTITTLPILATGGAISGTLAINRPNL